MPAALSALPLELALADCSVRAGFPSPAEDFSGKRLDIGELLVEHPQATFLLRVAGPSMREYGIDDGDLIVVDRALRARHGSIVVAIVDSEFTVKALHNADGVFKLRAGNPTYPDIVPKENQELQIWGVVKSCIKRFA
ncbi:translesion error-prone DNA polymerase V autoproteolytic subunit [Comamonas sp. Y33R10-2]|uniref:LexA family protein n=1 Tax=Comamonas sp. Y33R10-2 TaxID=2853257 RepID=UPI001C5CC251|nr:translesion error-prone DNA polymerase V autoproteolytic subunit [Comamonas sp. Y33R10-2]QXZ11240.1 translesion error-prone DNA polymerase V autoproteolytic subunit [Comamonas sp. Y33R10-2]